jgi:uncharacterized membrane protein
VKFPVACFTLLVAGAGVLIARDNENAVLYVGVIGLLSVIAAVIVLAVLAKGTADGPLQEVYSRVMIALVAGAAGTGGGIGGGAVVSQEPADKAQAAQKTAQEAKTVATQAKREATGARTTRRRSRR